ncbi:hypothetical protein MKW94_013363, partial [Papaver nudicaule]|nr:hypothetical protein [Papaver nudicaule]
MLFDARPEVDFDEFPEVDKVLTQRNYTKWKDYMEKVLKSKYLWRVVDVAGDWIWRRSSISGSCKKMNHKALEIIKMSCGEEMLRYLENQKSDTYLIRDELNRAAYFLNKIDSAYYAWDNLRIDQEHNELLTSINDYRNWAFCMKKYLTAQGLWGFLVETEISDCVKDEMALDAIKASCAPNMRAYILYMNCAKDAWEKLTTVAANSTEHEVHVHCGKVEEAANIRANLREYSEADKVLTRSNFQRWEEYVILLLRSLFLYDVVLPIDHALNRTTFTDYGTKEACALRIIKAACGREMMPCIFRSKYPEEALNSLRKACSLDQKDDYMKYSRLLHAVQTNRFTEQIKDRNGELWRGAHNFFRDFPEALTAEITEDGSTALHVSVRLGRVDFVKELLELMTVAQTESKTHQGSTAIAIAARGNNMEIVKMLVNKNPHLPQICDNNELHAVTIAAINGNEKIMHYLYPLTSKSIEWWGARSVASFLTSAARLNAFGIVRNLLNLFPEYALVLDNYGKCTLLSVLAEKPSAFPSENQFGFLKEWIIYRWAQHVTLYSYGTVPGMKQLLTINEEHEHTAVILQQICSQLTNMNPHQLRESFITDAIHRSIINGTVAVFEILIQTNPYLEHFKDENGRGLFQIAIINRQESMFRYMSRMGQRNHDMDLLDDFGNNALHCAAIWDPSSRLVIHGPALQMQREIQWFQ